MNTIFVRRENGKVVGWGRYFNPDGGYSEELAEDHPDVAAYNNPPPGIDDYKLAIVAHLDAKAQERRYDNAVSIATYTGSTNPQWVAEASAFIAWRDAVWAYAYTELDKVMNGQRPQPSIIELRGELPGLMWP